MLRLRFVAPLLVAASTLVGCRCGGEDAPPAEEGVTPVAEGSATPAAEDQAREFALVDGCDAVPNDSVAVVNCESVLASSELQALVDDVVARYERLPGREPTDTRWRNMRRERLVQTAVQQAILSQHVAASGVEVTDEEVEERIRADLEHVFDDERLFSRFLESHGTTREEYFDEMRGEMALDRVLDARARETCPSDPETTPACRLEPSDEDVERFYEDNRERWREGERIRARVITIRLRSEAGDDEVAEARERIEALRDRVTSGGEDFSEVARAESESADRLRGGDRGWIVRGRRQQLVDDGIEDALFDTRPGRVTEPLRTSLGFQIFLIDDHRPEGFRALDEVRAILHEPLRNRNRDRLSRQLETELAEQHDVVYLRDNWGLEDEAAEGSAAAEPQPE